MMDAQRRTARIAGLFYLLVAVLSGFAELYVRPLMLVTGDAAATVQSIVHHAGLVRLGFVADLVGITCNVFAAIALYLLLRPTSRDAASAMVVFASIMAAIMYVLALDHFGALLVATSPSYDATLGANGVSALVMLLVELQKYGYLVAQIFFGLWLLPMGYLVYRSGLFPRTVGVALGIGCFGYIADTLTRFLVPALAPALSPFFVTPAGIAEFWMIGYLLVKGVGRPRGGLVAA